MKAKNVVAVWMVLVGLFSLVSCNYTHDKMSKVDMDSMDFQFVSANITGPMCMKCHSSSTAAASGGGLDLSTYAKLTAPSLIVPFNPDASPLYQAVASGRMPKSGAKLSDYQLSCIAAWIKNGAPEVAGTQVTPPPPPPPPVPKFSYISKYIFTPYCINCHNATNSKGDLDLTSYDSLMATPGVVRPNDGDTSKLYIVLEIGKMPPAPAPALSNAQQQAIYDWINAGADNN